MVDVIQAVRLTVAQRKRLVRARELKGMSRSQLAAALGVSWSMVAHLENGTKAAPVGLLRRAAKALDLSLTVQIVVKLETTPTYGKPGK